MFVQGFGPDQAFVEMGTRIQVNAGSITGDSGRSAKKFVKQLWRAYGTLWWGTDAHGVDHRQPKMKKAAEYVERKYGEEYMRRIFFSNAKELLRKRREKRIRITRTWEWENDEITIGSDGLISGCVQNASGASAGIIAAFSGGFR